MRVPVLIRASFVGVVLTTPAEKDGIAFHPEAGTTLDKVFEISSEFALDSVSLMVDGQDVGAMLGQVELTVESSATVAVSDVYKAVADGRPLELLRTFERLENAMTMSFSQAPEMPEIAVESELEGKTVAFKWNEDKGEYELSFHESEGGDDLLEGLEEDMDLRFLLPAGEVEVDDSWKVEIIDLLPLTMPGGNLHFASEDAEMDEEAMEMFEGFMESLGAKVGDLIDGQCVCTYKGTRDEAGTRVGEIQIEIEASGSIDLREILLQIFETAMAQAPAEVEANMDIGTADLSVEYKGSGVLLWNLAAGRVHSLALDGEVGFGFKLDAEFEANGESHGVDAALEMSGEMQNEVSTEE